MQKAIGYIRVSTVAQAGDDKYGIEVQKRAIEQYAEKNGYEVVDWKIDEISGVKDDRPAFNEILGGAVTNPPVSAVIIFKNDRLARDTKLYFYYLFVLEKKNIKLCSVEEDFPEGSEFVNIYRSLMQFAAEQERRNIALRTGRARSVKASCGGYSGGRAPFGYMVQNGKLVINEDEAWIVREIFAAYKAGKRVAHITDDLNDRGIRTRGGHRFQNAGVRSILDNEKTYRGFYRFGKEVRDWVKGVHEPLLKDDDEPES